MDITVSAADANRRFSELLRGVREGKTYIVTSHGRPVAQITPPAEGEASERAAREGRWKNYVDELRNRPARHIGPWTREDLYDRGEGG
jgi:prevent-host-death family protein